MWIELNTDGAVSVLNGLVGGVFRDSDAKWICKFTMRTREESGFKIKKKAILEALKTAWVFEFRKVEVECDNAIEIETILAGGGVNSKLSELRLIHQLLGCYWKST